MPGAAGLTSEFRRFPSPIRRTCSTVLAAFLVQASAHAEALEGQPLAARSTPAGKTMFTLLPAEQTGVRAENRYADPEMWGSRYHEFEIGPIGTGVAIGDYDGDGKPDIFVVSKTESCRLFRNLGNWKFEDVTEKSGVADSGAAASIWKEGATWADVNNDGRLDLYVCRWDAPNLLYVNQGDGTFKEQAKAAGLDVKDASTMATFCDYDRDGWLDVYVQTNLLNNSEHPSGQRDYLFHNNRDGTFTNVTDQAGMSKNPTQGNSATWWDYNNDGWPDLYVANDFAGPDWLYRNNRDGTFTNVVDSVVPHMTYSSMGSDLGDLNNDGLIDFMVADMAATSHLKDQRTMADTRSRTKDPAPDSTAVPTYLHNAVYLNSGRQRCLEAAYLTGLDATDWTWSLRFEDLDNDGRLDLHVTNGMHREIHNTDLILRMMTAEGAYERVRIARSSPVLNEPNLAFRNLGDLRFENVSAAWGLDQRGVSFGAAFGDLDGDGDLDLVYTNYEAGPTVLRNDSPDGHRIMISLKGTRSNRFGVGSSVEIATTSGKQIRQLVLARGYMSSSEPAIHFGLGQEEVIQRLTVKWPSGAVQSFDNVRGDQRITITEPADSAGPNQAAPTLPPGQFTEISESSGFAQRSKEEPIDEISQQRFLPTRLNRRGPALAVGMLDSADTEFVVIGGTSLTSAKILGMDAPGHFVAGDMPVPKQGLPINDGPVLIFDANGDGAADLLITRGGASQPAGATEYQPVLMLSNGQGGFSPAPSGALPNYAASTGALCAADFDHDGRLDLFIGGRVSPGEYPSAPASALWINSDRGFVDVTSKGAPRLANVGMVTSALWSDVDGDGWADLIVALEWGAVKYFHNHLGQSFEDWSEKAGFSAAGTGWWTGLATADFNGDGRPDFVVGNVGLNTQYHADAQHPSVLYWGNFNTSGQPLLVEGYYEGENLYPWRTRKDLGAAIPALLKKFTRNDTYARATLPEILGEPALAAAEKFTATELQSGVFLSQKDGTYQFVPLPRIAQISPLQGIVTGDFDGDGYADIYAVQNSYAPNPVVARYDGGLSQLLRGDGRGHFTAVTALESNLVVPGDAKALSVIDADKDGWPDFLITRNNSTSMAYRNNGVVERKSYRVLLRGKVPNANAIGAVITANYADQSKLAIEVTANSGLYSQSSSARFFGSSRTHALQSWDVAWPSGQKSHHELSRSSADRTLIFNEP